MKRSALSVGVALLMVAVFCSMAFAAAAAPQTFAGKINDKKQLVADDGKVYEIAAGEKGDKLAAMKDKKVSVTGTVAQKDGKNVITVTDYKEAAAK